MVTWCFGQGSSLVLEDLNFPNPCSERAIPKQTPLLSLPRNPSGLRQYQMAVWQREAVVTILVLLVLGPKIYQPPRVGRLTNRERYLKARMTGSELRRWHICIFDLEPAV